MMKIAKLKKVEQKDRIMEKSLYKNPKEQQETADMREGYESKNSKEK